MDYFSRSQIMGTEEDHFLELGKLRRERDGVDDYFAESAVQPLSDILSEKPLVKIVPPGLRQALTKFIYHCELAQRKRLPVMICGPSGVGKSMFIELYIRAYKWESSIKESYKKPYTVNCSHFEGELAKSELFGHTKGAFTGANEDHEGWIKKADGGVLILEEIGELPLATQSKLLTFIETGEFHKVGSTEIEKSEVLIVGATNNEYALRNDFRYRFFPFYIPPLYTRREDILYYFAVLFPRLLPSLKPFEILALLAYNWPGNVRELERVGNLLILSHKYARHDAVSPFRASILDSFSENDTDLKVEKAYWIYLELLKGGYGADDMEKYLNDGLVGISPYNCDNPLSVEEFRIVSQPYYIWGVAVLVRSEMIEKVFRKGLIRFCSLFHQDPTTDKNLLEIREGSPSFFNNDTIIQQLIEIARNDKMYDKLERMILYFLGNIEVPKTFGLIPSKQSEWDDFIEKLEEIYPQSPLFCRDPQSETSSINKKEPDYWSLSKNELLREYYSRLLKRTGGNEAAASRIAKEHPRTFRDSIRRFGAKQ